MDSVAMKNNRVYTIKSPNGLIGLTHKCKNYIIGFPMIINAYRVKTDLHWKSNDLTYIQDNNNEDISNDINDGLDSLGIDSSIHVNDVRIDLSAKLVLPKKNYCNLLTGFGTAYSINHIDYNEFLMYPFNHNLGIIFPYELYREDKDKYIFLSRLVEPCETSVDMFRKSLDK
jgi:hypothetical protein